MQDKIKEALFSALESLEPRHLASARSLCRHRRDRNRGAVPRGGLGRFCRSAKVACEVMRWNLDHTGLTDRSEVLQMLVPAFLRRKRAAI